MSKGKKLVETDLYYPVRDFLQAQGYTVRSEVRRCDITATKGDQLLIVELKLSLNTTLLVQAIDRQRLTDLVYVALPKPSTREWSQRWPGLQQLLRRLELGLLLVSFTGGDGFVEVAFDPGPTEQRKSPRRLQAVLREIAGRTGDYNLGGSSRRKLLTAYKEQCLYIVWWLQQLGPQSPQALRLRGTCDQTPSMLYRNYYGWYIHQRKGSYEISEAGAQALLQYSELVTNWRNSAAAQLTVEPSTEETRLPD